MKSSEKWQHFWEKKQHNTKKSLFLGGGGRRWRGGGYRRRGRGGGGGRRGERWSGHASGTGATSTEPWYTTPPTLFLSSRYATLWHWNTLFQTKQVDLKILEKRRGSNFWEHLVSHYITFRCVLGVLTSVCQLVYFVTLHRWLPTEGVEPPATVKRPRRHRRRLWVSSAAAGGRPT